MFMNFKSTALTLSLFALLSSTEMFAAQDAALERCRNRHQENVIPAQANYQDVTTVVPFANIPISFTQKNFRTNVDVNDQRTVFEVEVPGLYSLDAFLLVSLPNEGDVVEGYITINENKYLTFFEREVRTVSPVVNFHFNDRLVYLKKGDRVSVVLTDFPSGTLVLSRGFVMVALNNSN